MYGGWWDFQSAVATTALAGSTFMASPGRRWDGAARHVGFRNVSCACAAPRRTQGGKPLQRRTAENGHLQGHANCKAHYAARRRKFP